MSATSQLVDEKTLAAQVAELAKMIGYRRYHTYRSKRSEPGWPDEALVRDRLVLLELKSDLGKLSGAQKDWLRALRAAGVECYLIRPDDLQDLAAVLAARGGIGSLERERLRQKLDAALA